MHITYSHLRGIFISNFFGNGSNCIYVYGYCGDGDGFGDSYFDGDGYGDSYYDGGGYGDGFGSGETIEKN